jgi:hypothetical protein
MPPMCWQWNRRASLDRATYGTRCGSSLNLSNKVFHEKSVFLLPYFTLLHTITNLFLQSLSSFPFYSSSILLLYILIILILFHPYFLLIYVFAPSPPPPILPLFILLRFFPHLLSFFFSLFLVKFLSFFITSCFSSHNYSTAWPHIRVFLQIVLNSCLCQMKRWRWL